MARATGEKAVKVAMEGEKPGSFPIVGIGSSAGGIPALIEFFEAMPERNGIAFVVVQHTAADVRSYLREILQAHSKMKVVEALDNTRVEPDYVYVFPSDQNVTLSGTRLILSKKPNRPYIAFSIDFLFRSMAETLGDRAIGIVLSGAGSDGTFGSKLINHRLGIVFAQDPSTAEFADMPDSIIKIGVADYVLAPKDMPARLIAFVRDYYGKPIAEREKELRLHSHELDEVFRLSRERTRLDLSVYKLSTVYRRIDRRMSLHRLTTIDEYVELLKRDQHELDKLTKEFLILVTTFFQEPGEFAVLKGFLKDALSQRPVGSTVRTWTMGCGTGEDTYSFAILIRECIDELDRDLDFRVFATDIDEASLNIARNGIYPASIIDQDVSGERVRKYFNRIDSTYRVNDNVRSKVLFSIRPFVDPPMFADLDLITSRSVLASLNADSQKKLIPVFHSILNRDGLLVPGTEDSVEAYRGLFRLLNERWKIYQREPAEISPDRKE